MPTHTIQIKPGDSVYVEVEGKPVTIEINATHEGIVVDAWPTKGDAEVSCSLWATYNEFQAGEETPPSARE